MRKCVDGREFAVREADTEICSVGGAVERSGVLLLRQLDTLEEGLSVGVEFSQYRQERIKTGKLRTGLEELYPSRAQPERSFKFTLRCASTFPEGS